MDKAPDKERYACGEEVTLTATPDMGWEFGRWDGAAIGSTNPVTVSYNISDTVTVIFSDKPRYGLTVSTTGNGTASKDPDQPTYIEGTAVMLTATPDDGWFFKEWQGDIPTGAVGSTTTTLMLTMDREKMVTALFEKTPPSAHSLTVAAVGQGSISKSPDQATYTPGTQVTLTATANTGWAFMIWQGDVPPGSTAPTIVLNVDGDKAIKAVFGHTLTVDIEGQGSVGKSPDQAVYLNGAQVTLTAMPNAGWRFKTWQGDVPIDAENEVLTLTLDEAKTVKAIFEADVTEIYLPVVRTQ